MSTPTGGQYGDDPTRQQQAGDQQYGQPQYGQQQYGQAPYDSSNYGGAAAPPQQPKNGLGITALVLGIIAILTFWTVILGVLLGLLAIIFGIIGLRRANRGQATNKGVAIAGLVTGALGLIASVAYVVLVGSVFLGIGGGDYISCLQQAGQNQAQVEQCAQEFQQNVQQRSGS